MKSTQRLTTLLFALVLVGCTGRPTSVWQKGNVHTHSLWSDGDDFPEMVIDWYRQAGYDFVALSDHNTLAEGERWISTARLNSTALGDYLERFGPEWVEYRTENANTLVRLKSFEEYRSLLEQPGAFVVIQAEEITDSFERKPVHVIATNLAERIDPQGGNSIVEVMQRNVDAVLDQRRRTGRPMIPHIAHPNYRWALTAEEIAAVTGERFFEVYNGHPAVHNAGDSTRIGTDAMWDLILTERLRRGRDAIYGLAVDDAHHYHTSAPDRANAGRGWIQVRTRSLTPDSLIAAMERGDFYASSGVELRDVQVTRTALAVEIEPEDGVEYTIDFIGTRFTGADVGTEASNAGPDIGVVMERVRGTVGSYAFRGNELYVRAKVTSSRIKSNGLQGELEAAWVQPVLP